MVNTVASTLRSCSRTSIDSMDAARAGAGVVLVPPVGHQDDHTPSLDAAQPHQRIPRRVVQRRPAAGLIPVDRLAGSTNAWC